MWKRCSWSYQLLWVPFHRSWDLTLGVICPCWSVDTSIYDYQKISKTPRDTHRARTHSQDPYPTQTGPEPHTGSRTHISSPELTGTHKKLLWQVFVVRHTTLIGIVAQHILFVARQNPLNTDQPLFDTLLCQNHHFSCFVVQQFLCIWTCRTTNLLTVRNCRTTILPTL